MAVPFDLASAADLVDVAIQKIWLKTDYDDKKYYPEYFNVETGVSDYYLKESSLTGLGRASRIAENAVIQAQSPIQGFDQTFTQVEFGKLLRITKKMWKFGIQKRDLTRVTAESRRACEVHREILCADRIDNMFSTTYTVTDDAGSYTASIDGGDSFALIYNAHTREDGGTAWNNRVTDGTTVNMDFEYDALKAAHRTASLITNPRGLNMNVNLDTLVLKKGTANYFRAMEMLGAIRKNMIPGSADNDSAGVMAFKVLALPWIQTNTAYWAMYDSSMKGLEYGLQYKESQPIQMEGPNIVFATGEIQYKATMMFDIGFNDARNWIGSKNTNAS